MADLSKSGLIKFSAESIEMARRSSSKNVVGKVGRGVAGATRGVGKGVKEVAGGVGKGVVSVASGVGKGVKNVAGGVGKGVKDIASGFGLGGVAKGVAKFLGLTRRRRGGKRKGTRRA